ncbi:hypothetical protein QJS66_01470 [Kocuria rhizophila]|nr:hypothetical protein QJS66_01470 [Kocuria rhizophila]
MDPQAAVPAAGPGPCARGVGLGDPPRGPVRTPPPWCWGCGPCVWPSILRVRTSPWQHRRRGPVGAGRGAARPLARRRCGSRPAAAGSRPRRAGIVARAPAGARGFRGGPPRAQGGPAGIQTVADAVPADSGAAVVQKGSRV